MGYSLLKVVSIVYLFITLSTNIVFADVYINEFSSSTSNDDWIELFNDGTEDVDLAKYRIRDDTESNKLELNGILAAGEFKNIFMEQ